MPGRITPVVGWTVSSPVEVELLLGLPPADEPSKIVKLAGAGNAPMAPGAGVAKVRLREQFTFSV